MAWPPKKRRKLRCRSARSASPAFARKGVRTASAAVLAAIRALPKHTASHRRRPSPAVPSHMLAPSPGQQPHWRIPDMRISRLWKVIVFSIAVMGAGAGIDPADMDPTAAACKNFYQYADGGWIRKNPIPPEYPSWGTFNELAERNRELLHQILERSAKNTSAARGSDEQKIGDFFASCMDEAAIEAQGIQPLKPEFDRIEAISNVADLQK